jgi:hypothetical protein
MRTVTVRPQGGLALGPRARPEEALEAAEEGLLGLGEEGRVLLAVICWTDMEIEST